MASPSRVQIDHPDYYNWIETIECIDVSECFVFNLGTAIKYIWRSGRKNKGEQIADLRKAIWYLEREISLVGNTEVVNDDQG